MYVDGVVYLVIVLCNSIFNWVLLDVDTNDLVLERGLLFASLFNCDSNCFWILLSLIYVNILVGVYGNDIIERL